MPAWNDYKETAKSRGALAYEVFIVQSTPAGSPEDLQRILPDHLAYQKEVEAAGNLVLAGPTSDETGEQMIGAGMIIYRADSMEAARAIADADPMHKEGARTYTIRKWLINEGGFTLTTRFSSQGFAFD